MTIKDCIVSVCSQSYPDIEHIIIDGASTDSTLAVIGKYNNSIAKVLSEPDNGIYDAMNKGIKMATGDIVGILNSDDFYANPNILEDVANVFEENKIDCCYGDLEYVGFNDTSKVIRKWKSRKFQNGLFRKGWHPPHPTFFVKKEIYERYGLFDLDLNISADYEIMLRFLEKYKIKSCYIPEVMVKMRTGGASNRNLKQILRANIQCCRAWKKNGYRISPITAIKKPLSKILQLKK